MRVQIQWVILGFLIVACGEDSASGGLEVEGVPSDPLQDGVGSVVINEVVAKAEDDGPDWVELYNPTDTPIELSGYQLQDNDDSHLYVFPDGIALEGGAFWVLEGKNSENEFTFPFGLGGEDSVRLLDASGDLVDEVSWLDGDAPAGRSLGRYPDGGEEWGQLETPTYEAPNAPFTGMEPEVKTDGTEVYFDPEEVLQVAIEIDQEDWDTLRSEARSLLDILAGDCLAEPVDDIFTWFSATVTVNGETLENVGVRKKGFLGSLSDIKPAMKVRFDKFEEDQLLGGVLKRLTLNNTIQDPSKLNTCMTYALYQSAGRPAPRCQYAKVEVNGEDMGIYVHIDAIKSSFLKRNFGTSDGNHYEGTLSDFREGWFGTMEKKTNEEEGDWSDIEALSAALEPENPNWETVGEWVDLDAFLTHWALEAIVNHWDGYGGNRNNYHIYRELDGPFEFIPWGADATFFEFEPGAEEEEQPPPAGVFINGLLSNRMYASGEWREKYRERMLELLDQVWDEAALLEQVDIWSEVVQAYAHPLEREPAEQDAERVREFIENRRDILLAEFGEKAPDESAEVGPPISCWEELGEVSLSFSGIWGTQESETPLQEGELTVNTLTYQGENIAFVDTGTTVGWGEVSEGEDAFWSLLLWWAESSGAVELIAFSFIPEMLQPGSVYSLDNWFPYGVRYRFQPPFYEPIPLDQIRGGTLRFFEADGTDGGTVSGELNARIFSF